ncbi:hypothetical protein EYM_01530 [Ignicoccus islandicus DSM 13165]|uniref:Uncharacterized protein n=1 Tax=Ignicoccus islandicus DSM 13165 TaxID=940295 RepID=A0A0U3DXJ5_9CREN|nr:hypothetical protein [Ignicoccus islandicus]ALU12218.1 hypothetical protein EYM_01530 [Ignicoccus islandicus DSM 13165]
MKITKVEVEMEVNSSNYLELVVLSDLITSLNVTKVYSPKVIGTELKYVEGLFVPKWRSKRLEGTREVIGSVLPFLIEGDVKASLWFQSPHPQGGVPDVMMSFGWEVSVSDNIVNFAEPAWRIERIGRSVRLEGLWWKPDLVIEVKRTPKRARTYPARKRLMVSLVEGEVTGWEVVELRSLREVIRKFIHELAHVY